MKRIISAISAVAIALSAMASVSFAADNDSAMQSVLESVKKRVEIPAECTEFSSGTQIDYGKTAYDFAWRTGNYSSEYKNVRVSCYDDGTITSYYTGLYAYDDSPSIMSVSEDEAKTIAEDFLKQLNPDFPYELQVEMNFPKTLYGNEYNFTVKTLIDGIALDGSGDISVNGKTGEVVGANVNYIPSEFPSKEGAISQEEAKKAYSEKLGLEMIYRTYTDEDGKDIAYPVYVQKPNYNKYINALTGEVIDLNYYNIRTYNMARGSIAKAEDATADSGLTPQEIEEIEKVKGLISKEDMERRIKSNKTLNLPQSMSISRINLSKSYNKDEYTYYIDMSDTDNKNFANIHANAKTGEILYYYRHEASLSESEAKQSDTTLKALAGSKADEYQYNKDSKVYERYVNGLRVSGDTASVIYNGNTLVNYNVNYTQADFPSAHKAMSVSDAEKVMFDKDGYDMVYTLNHTDEGLEIALIYKHNQVSINPFTGEYVDYRNEPITDNDDKFEYSDIDGHYAQSYIEELAGYGIGFDGGEFKPDEKITQKDYIALITSISRGGVSLFDDVDYIYRTAARNNILSADERDDNAIVTRETAAIYMIRAIGAEEYAKYNDIYVSPFKDVTENKGYSALLSAMGIVSGDENGNFNPNREITRAESIIMLYKYLTR